VQVPIDHSTCSDTARSTAATEFRAALAALGIPQTRVAELFNVNPRHIRRWRSGDRRLPHAVGLVVNLLTTGVVTIEQAEAAVPVLTRTNGAAKPKPSAAPEQPTLADPSLSTAEKVLALAPNACRWPYNDPRHPNFYFCSRPTAAPPYCNEHRSAAHMTRTPVGSQKPSSLTGWPPRNGRRSRDVDGPRTTPVALSV